MQRMIDANVPACRHGHPARRMQDMRGTAAGGGHYIECACNQSGRHPNPDDALADWHRQQGLPPPNFDTQRPLPLNNVLPMRRGHV